MFLSITTLERQLARRMEPRAATPERRLAVLSALRDIGARPGVMVAPLIPGLTDHELEGILAAARDAGAETAGYVALRMPHEIKDLFREWLAEHYPDRAARVIQLVRNIRGGKDYNAEFHTRLRGTGSYAALMERRFQVATRRLGFSTRRRDLDCTQFKKPQLPGDQLALF
ncbi:MAG: hypothetical protein R3360_05905 [Alphaproteobacteria bacterium]|nr:hypothetical protein [Alphaproteobacteria bacterium]